LPRFLINNWIIKLFSLLLALLLWIYVTGQVKSEMSFSAPLELTNIPSNLEITNELPPFISVRLRGSSSTLRNVRPGSIKVVLDLSHLREGKSVFHIDKGHIIIPKGLKVVRIKPESITIKAELLLEKKVPVVLNAKNTNKLNIKIEPSTVKIQGIKSKVVKIKKIYTEFLDLSNIELNTGKFVEKEVGLKNPAKGICFQPEKVKVIVSKP